MHLDTGRRRDVGGGDRPGPCLRRYMTTGSSCSLADDELLDVEDEVGDVFLDARHGGELVQNAVDADGDVTAAPGIEDRRVRRSELPRV